jgi:two-component system, NtrC family, sensor kinase
MANVVYSSSDSSHFMIPALREGHRHQRPARSAVLIVIGVVVAVAGLLGFLREVGEFQNLDFDVTSNGSGFLVVDVTPRSGAARAGIVRGDTITAIEGVPAATIRDLENALYAHNVSRLTLLHEGIQREVLYYPPTPQIDVRYLLVAFASMFTLVVAGIVFVGYPTPHARRFLALAEALFAAVVIPSLQQSDPLWQFLLLLRDFGRLALPPLLVVFFATFPYPVLAKRWRAVAFLPSLLVAGARTWLAVGGLTPVIGDILVPEALDAATAILAVAGVVFAAGLAVTAYVESRDDPTRRRQVEWVALGAAAGFAPYLLLSLIPQLAGAELEVLTWISLLPLTLVPLGVASSLLEFRLWDLEDISRQVFATGAVVLVGGVCFALFNVAITQAGFRFGNWRNLVAVGGGVLLVVLALPARRWLLESLERLQYRERLEARRALTTFAEEASAHRDPEELLARLAQRLRDAFAVDQVVTYLTRGDRLAPSPPDPSLPDLPSDDLHGAFPGGAERVLRERGLWHRFPLEREGRLLGAVYCSRRHGGLPLGHGERRLVGVLVAQATLALENTLLLHDLRRQVEEHRLLEGYLERVFQSSAAALVICDAQGNIQRANERAVTLLQRDAAVLAGRRLGTLVELPEEWGEVLPQDLASVPVHFAGGGERVGLLSISALESEPGRFDGRVVALDDISEQLRMEQRLAQQERLAALGRLAAGLAHEVNTPVTGIASYAQLLKELTPAGDPRGPLVEKLEEQSFRVARIVTNLMELARPTGFERQLVDVAAVAREEAARVRSDAERAGITVSCQADAEATSLGNRVQLELVIHNLLRNALQATPRGGRVAVEVTHGNGAVAVEVTDSGPGIPSDLAEHVFEPFVTTRQGRGGTGLGLAITRDIVVAHGGSIGVARSSAAGTALRVELPAAGRNA